jgi:phage shock protein E
MSSLMDFFTRTQDAYKHVECGELEKLLAQDGAGQINLVDVRTEAEHRGGHIPGSVNVNIYNPDFAERAAKLDKAKPVYVYCASGNRSRAACSQLSGMGFPEVYNVKMGMMGWAGEIA